MVGKLLGQEFDGTLVTDFYGGCYRKIKCEKQKCLTHLLRERDTAIMDCWSLSQAHSIGGSRLVKELLRLKKQKVQMEALA